MKAIVCLCHGYGDTCTFFLDGTVSLYVTNILFTLMFHFRYSSIFIVLAGIARKIASAGYGVFALDYPGFGLSEGLHGYIPSFDTLVDDVAETFAKFKGIAPFYYCWFLALSLSIYTLLGTS
jgi:acylglycerol lipase